MKNLSRRTLTTRLSLDNALIFRALAHREQLPVSRLLKKLVMDYIAREKRKAGIPAEEVDGDS